MIPLVPYRLTIPSARSVTRLVAAFVAALIVLLPTASNEVFAQTSPGQGSSAQSLRDSSNIADYVIVTHPDFENEIRLSFVPWRASKGYQVRVVTTDAIYREFLNATDAPTRSEAVRAFTSTVLQTWKKAQPARPLHFLLVGSAAHIPTYRVNVTDPLFVDLRRYEDSVALDEMFVVNKFTRDTRPQAAIGRFPARTVEDVRTIVAKTKLFEDGAWLRYANDFVGISDVTDATWFEVNMSGTFDFLRVMQRNAAQRMPLAQRRPLKMREINYRPASINQGSRQEIFRAINESTMFVSYYGHGAPDTWSTARILTTKDVDTVFLPQTLPFIVTSVGCRQDFSLPDQLSIVERLVNRTGGAVATFTSSGFSLLPEGDFALQFFYITLLNDSTGRETIGTAALASKRDGMSSSAPLDYFYRRLTILGDPALKVPLTKLLSARTNDATGNDITESVRPQALPNPASASTAIRYTLERASNVGFEVFDMLGNVVLSGDEGVIAAGTHVLTVNTSSLPNGAYLVRFRMEARGGQQAQERAVQTAQTLVRVVR